MEGKEAPGTRLLKLVRYFAFTIIAVVVLVAAFLVTSRNISSQIQTVTDQALNDSTRQESASIQKFVGLIIAQTTLIAQHNADHGAKAMVEALRSELKSNVLSAQIGFVNAYGYMIYGDQPKISVASEEWFIQSKSGEEQVFLFSRDKSKTQLDFLVAAPVYSTGGFLGVLFVTIDGEELASRINTQVYGGKAASIICNSEGTILFVEPKLSGISLGNSIFDFAGAVKMHQRAGALGLAAALKRGVTTSYTYQYSTRSFYATCAPVGVLDWRVITFVDTAVADVVQRQVTMYLIGMLLVMLTIGIAMAIQAYVHEQSTVRKLEHDKDLLQQGAERYRIITKLSNEVLFQVDNKSGNISFNDNFEGMFGFPPPICTVDDIDNCLPLIAEVDRERFFAMMQRMRATTKEAHEELRMVHARGVVRWKRVDIFSIFDQTGKTVEFVGKIVDVHRQRQSLQRLIRQADSDPLTGLLNRASMERNIKEFLSSEGLSGTHALLMMDFDNFKAVNDTLGHAKGDDLLVSFAAVIRHVFRSGDFSSRIGGDEYMVFVKNISDDCVAQEKAEELRGEMTALSKKIGVPVSVSIGIALYRQDADSFEHLYKAADDALYYVKNHGKNSVSFFSACNKPESKTE
jgi:diguanylate cyclase (GGDEF)-like protein/PAS domain S-box-containing protein